MKEKTKNILDYSNYTQEELEEYFKCVIEMNKPITKENLFNFIGKWGETEYGKSEEYLKDKKELIPMKDGKLKLRRPIYKYSRYRKGQLFENSSFFDDEYQMLLEIKGKLDKAGYFNDIIVFQKKLIGLGKGKEIAYKIF